MKIQNVDKGGRGGGRQPIWIIIKFYNIILKFANVDKGGGETLIHKMWIKKTFFINFSLIEVKWAHTASSFYWCTYLNVD